MRKERKKTELFEDTLTSLGLVYGGGEPSEGSEEVRHSR